VTTARRLIVVGAGGHGRAVGDVAAAAGWTVVGYTERAGARAGDPSVLGADEDLAVLAKRHDAVAVVGVGNTALARRAELFATVAAACRPAPALVHPRATVSPSATLAAGAVVFANAVVGAHVVIGENAVLYSGAIVEHDSRIGAHAYLSPGVVLAGSVTVDEGAFLGAGAVVLPGVRVGRGAVVGAGALVREDVAPGATVAGVPARPL
jgi:sugar O-acyltransferase (sialic acid O-acetyltransferase NeuD family)